MRKEYAKDKSGLYALGYIQNESSYLADLVKITDLKVTKKDLDANIDESYRKQHEINYCYDANGNLHSGEYDDKRTCRYAIYTGYDSPSPVIPDLRESIYAVFAKDQYGKWNGVKFFTRYKLEKYYNVYRFGNLSFRDYEEANSFIKELEASLLPGESWSFKSSDRPNYRLRTEYDILQSYLQHYFDKLLADYNDPDSKNYRKIVFSKNQRYALFNSGLLDKFAQDIFLVGEVYGRAGGSFTLSNVKISPGKVELMRKYGFSAKDLSPYPGVIEFFDKLDDIIFNADVEIDLNFDYLSHIIEDGTRRGRFSEKYCALYKKGDLPSITSTLIAAIEKSKKIAKRNYKYIIPQYRSATRNEPGKIQFLMPIYLDGQYGERPDFALVLNCEVMPDGTKFYTPETILELPWAYNNARVICKLEETWLNPKSIESPPPEEDL